MAVRKTDEQEWPIFSLFVINIRGLGCIWEFDDLGRGFSQGLAEVESFGFVACGEDHVFGRDAGDGFPSRRLRRTCLLLATRWSCFANDRRFRRTGWTSSGCGGSARGSRRR